LPRSWQTLKDALGESKGIIWKKVGVTRTQ